MDEFVTKFVNLQRYIQHLKEEKAKVYRFISCLPPTYKEKIEFEMPKTMDEAIRKSKLCYHLFKQRSELTRYWKNKKMRRGINVRKDLNLLLLGKEREVILIISTINQAQLLAVV